MLRGAGAISSLCEDFKRHKVKHFSHTFHVEHKWGYCSFWINTPVKVDILSQKERISHILKMFEIQNSDAALLLRSQTMQSSKTITSYLIADIAPFLLTRCLEYHQCQSNMILQNWCTCAWSQKWKPLWQRSVNRDDLQTDLRKSLSDTQCFIKCSNIQYFTLQIKYRECSVFSISIYVTNYYKLLCYKTLGV